MIASSPKPKSTRLKSSCPHYPQVLTPPHSQDHRGTPEAPGRVVTLIEHSFWATLADPHPAPADGKVWGVAYRIEPARVAEVKEYLDIREINGYSIHYTAFHPASPASPSPSETNPEQPIRTLVYIGTPDNDQFTGPQDVQALAEHIYRSEGPSGLNRAYLLSLDEALRELGPNPESRGDEHVSDLSARVRAIMAAHGQQDELAGGAMKQSKALEEDDKAAAARHPHEGEGGAVQGVDAQEETEKTTTE